MIFYKNFLKFYSLRKKKIEYYVVDLFRDKILSCDQSKKTPKTFIVLKNTKQFFRMVRALTI